MISLISSLNFLRCSKIFSMVSLSVFNVADCFICIGVGLMLLAIIKEEKNDGKASV